MHHYYELFPKIVEAGAAAQFEIKPRFEPSVLEPGASVSLQIRSKRDFMIRQVISMDVTTGGSLRFEYRPEAAGEFIVLVYPPGVSWPDQTSIVLGSAFFAVTRDMMKKRPYKGDFHIHTAYDEKLGESPVFLAARCRELGLDYAAITEHRYYDASLEAIHKAEERNFDILLFPGEEVNYAPGLGHILSINASCGMDEKIRPFMRSDYEELSGILKDMARKNSTKYEPSPAAHPEFFIYVDTVVREIRKAGGFAVIAHPFWKNGGVFDMVCPTYERILNEGLYDAIELIGDTDLEDNMLSIAKYQQRLAKGENIPIVSNSDSHRGFMRTLGRMWTICFTEKLERKSVLDAIADSQSVACLETGDNGVLVFGPFPLVELAYFLIREFFPVHDNFCQTLGKLYQHELETGIESKEVKTRFQNQIKQLYKRYWDGG